MRKIASTNNKNERMSAQAMRGSLIQLLQLSIVTLASHCATENLDYQNISLCIIVNRFPDLIVSAKTLKATVNLQTYDNMSLSMFARCKSNIVPTTDELKKMMRQWGKYCRVDPLCTPFEGITCTRGPCNGTMERRTDAPQEEKFDRTDRE